ncbi:folate family ECF transporter S component [Lacticaseibacillus mingshuiensis]|uniref:Folate family ECF transporter S component n=1 Tax=Lacticaseibacillus mingshuiensis TaxID=2799574 RepID=A0ABW4CGB2_9LACO|nr:folate family ECF transporter S component [Lacticaseibacillus mingshuiensis]
MQQPVLSLSSPKMSTRTVVYMAMFMVFSVILSRFSFGNTWLQISPAFLATVLMGYYLGPWWGAVDAAFADQFKTILFSPGSNFPGFTLTAAVAAILYGLFLHERKVSLVRTIIPFVLVMVIANIFLNTLWLNIMGTPWQGIIGVRTVKNLIELPINVALGYAVLKTVERVKPHIAF